MGDLWESKLGRVAKRLLPAAVIGMGLAGALSPNAAQAQFFGGWDSGWGGGGWGMGPGQIYQSISERGFQVVAPLRRNGAVFVAEVLDRRGRRERLIVAAADGEILQRFILDDGRMPGFVPRGVAVQPRPDFEQPVERADREDLVPPASIPNVNRNDTVVEPFRPHPAPKAVRPPRPRVVDRTPDEPAASRHESVPSHNMPRLKLRAPSSESTAKRPTEPPTTTANRPADTPEKPSVPAPTPAAPSTTTTKLTDPLAIPGGEPRTERPPAESPKASAAASGTGTATSPRIIPGTVTGAPAPTAPASPTSQAPAKSSDVPVAPLD